MTDLRGKITAVRTFPTGSDLMKNAPIGATYLEVGDVSDFSGNGGSLLVGPDVLVYNTVDISVSPPRIILAVPLVAALTAGEPILLYRYSEEKRALVKTSLGDDGVWVRLPRSIEATVSDGIRDPDEQETIVFGSNHEGTLEAKEITASWFNIDPVHIPEIAQINVDLTALEGRFPVTTPDIAPNAITSDKLVDGAVLNAKLAALSISTAKIQVGAVTEAELANLAVSSGKLVDGAVLEAKLGAAAVTVGKIADGAVLEAKLAANSVSTGKILDDAINAAKIAVNAVGSSELSAGAVIAGKIAAGTIVAADIAAGTITAAQIAANTLTANEIAANAITASELAASAVVAGKIAAGTIVAADIAAGTITATQIAAGAITTEKLTVGAAGDNVVLNGDLELARTDEPTTPLYFVRGGWSTHVPTTANLYLDTTQFYSGTKSVRMVTSGGVHPNFRSVHAVPVVAGEQWYVGVRVKGNTATSGGLYVRLMNQNGTEVNQTIENRAVSTSWALYDGTFTIPAGMTSMRLFVLMHGQVDAYTCWVDDVTLQKNGVSVRIADGTVSAEKIVANTITANEIAVDAITASELAASSVVAGDIVAGTIVAGDIATDTITANQIAANAITTNEISANTIIAADIFANTLTAGEIATNAITSDEIAAATIVAADIAANTITASQILASTITGNEIAANTITAADIAANTITAGQIAANTITAGQIAANTITTGQLSATAIDGMTVTGAILRTATSGQRMQMRADAAGGVIEWWSTGGETTPGMFNPSPKSAGVPSVTISTPKDSLYVADASISMETGRPALNIDSKIYFGANKVTVGDKLQVDGLATFGNMNVTGTLTTTGLMALGTLYTANSGSMASGAESANITITHNSGSTPRVVAGHLEDGTWAAQVGWRVVSKSTTTVVIKFLNRGPNAATAILNCFLLY